MHFYSFNSTNYGIGSQTMVYVPMVVVRLPLVVDGYWSQLRGLYPLSQFATVPIIYNWMKYIAGKSKKSKCWYNFTHHTNQHNVNVLLTLDLLMTGHCFWLWWVCHIKYWFFVCVEINYYQHLERYNRLNKTKEVFFLLPFKSIVLLQYFIDSTVVSCCLCWCWLYW